MVIVIIHITRVASGQRAVGHRHQSAPPSPRTPLIHRLLLLLWTTQARRSGDVSRCADDVVVVVGRAGRRRAAAEGTRRRRRRRRLVGRMLIVVRVGRPRVVGVVARQPGDDRRRVGRQAGPAVVGRRRRRARLRGGGDQLEVKLVLLVSVDGQTSRRLGLRPDRYGQTQGRGYSTAAETSRRLGFGPATPQFRQNVHVQKERDQRRNSRLSM